MSEVLRGPGSVATDRDTQDVAPFGVADLLSLAATPTFAIMALLSGVPGDWKMAMICGGMPTSSFVGGMLPMYLLMSGFHLTPWLRLLARWRGSLNQV